MANGLIEKRDLSAAQELFNKPEFITNEYLLREIFLKLDPRQVHLLILLIRERLKFGKGKFKIRFLDYDMILAQNGLAAKLPPDIRKFFVRHNIELQSTQEILLVWNLIENASQAVDFFEEQKTMES